MTAHAEARKARMVPRVQVTWADSLHPGGEGHWLKRENLEAIEAPQPSIVTMGYLIGESENHLTLTMSLGWQYGAILRIPRAAASAIERLGEVPDPFHVEGEA